MKQNAAALRSLALAAIVALSLSATNSTAQGYGNDGYNNGNGNGNNGYGNNGYGNNNGYDDNYNNGDANSNGGSYQQFYNELSPYGQWIQDPQYGYVWAPNAGRDFRPYYTNGYWTMTDYGNTWVSNYNWGWAPFHYGRWTFDQYYGWEWIPGNTWGPAWVNWRNGGGNYGWCPLGPGVSINIAVGNRWNPDPFWWCFVPQRWVHQRGFQQYCYQPRQNNTYINNTTIINNTYVTNNNTYLSGPGRRELERTTGAPVPVYHVSDRRNPGLATINGGNASFYRPAVRQATRAGAKPAQSVRADQVAGRNQAGTGRVGAPTAVNPAAGATNTLPSRNIPGTSPRATDGRSNATLQDRNTNNGIGRNVAPVDNRQADRSNTIPPQPGRSPQMNMDASPRTQAPPARPQPVQRYEQPTRPAPVYNNRPDPRPIPAPVQRNTPVYQERPQPVRQAQPAPRAAAPAAAPRSYQAPANRPAEVRPMPQPAAGGRDPRRR